VTESRKAFEAWFFSCSPPQNYDPIARMDDAQKQWDAWQAAVAHEREACAKVCDEMADWPLERHPATTLKSFDYQTGIVRGLVNATNAIRARSKT